MEILQRILFSPEAQLILPIGLLILVLYSRRKIQKEMMALSPEEKERLYTGFGRYRLLQFLMIGVIIIPVLMISFRVPFFQDQPTYPFLLAASILVLWFTLGYEMLKRKLKELALPESFIQAYMGDRLVMAVTLSLLLFFAYRQLPPG